MDIKEIISGAVQLTQTLGFPVAVCYWFMFRMEKKTDKQTEVLVEAVTLLKQILTSHDGGN